MPSRPNAPANAQMLKLKHRPQPLLRTMCMTADKEGKIGGESGRSRQQRGDGQHPRNHLHTSSPPVTQAPVSPYSGRRPAAGCFRPGDRRGLGPYRSTIGSPSSPGLPGSPKPLQAKAAPRPRLSLRAVTASMTPSLLHALPAACASVSALADSWLRRDMSEKRGLLQPPAAGLVAGTPPMFQVSYRSEDGSLPVVFSFHHSLEA